MSISKNISDSKSRQEIRKEKRRKEIVDVAAELMAVHGYLGTTFEMIASEIGITKTGLYNYINSKEEIAVLLIKKIIHLLEDETKGILEQQLDTTTTLRNIIVAHVIILAENPAASILISESEHIVNKETDLDVFELRDQYETSIRKIIERGINEGVFKVDSIKLAGFIILGALNWISRWYSDSQKYSAKEIGHFYADVLIGGLIHPYKSTD